MSLLDAADRLAAMDRSAVTFVRQRCLHTQDRFSACQACFDVCPSAAIQPDRPPRLDPQACVGCLGCLPACPVGAYNADDEVSALLDCVPRIENGALELVCGLHPRPGQGAADGSVGLRLRGCLAGLGTGALVALAVVGARRVTLRLDACRECAWGVLQPRVQMQAVQASLILAHWSNATTVEVLVEPLPMVERPLWEVDNPPLSRRDLFRLAARQGQLAAARAMSASPLERARLPGRDRLRLQSAVDHLPPPDAQPDPEVPLQGFALLQISPACTACGACVRGCPTEALFYETDEKETNFSIKFSPRQCVACELCVHVCAPGALTLQDEASFGQVFLSPSPVELRSGVLSHCSRCNAPFAAQPGVTLCEVCAYRLAHPFGSRLPSQQGRLADRRDSHADAS